MFIIVERTKMVFFNGIPYKVWKEAVEDI